MRINEITEDVFDRFRSPEKLGQRQTQTTVKALMTAWREAAGRSGLDPDEMDSYLFTKFLSDQGFEDGAIDLAMKDSTSPLQAITKAVQHGDQARGTAKIPPEIIDDIKKLNMAQRRILAQVLLGQMKVT